MKLALIFVVTLSLMTTAVHGSVVRQEASQDGQTSAPSSDAAKPPTIPLKEAAEHITKRVKAATPPIAMAAHVTGEVLIGVVVEPSGRVSQAFAVNGPPMLQGAATEAAKQFEFTPFLVNGQPGRIVTAIRFKFAPGAYKSE